jgi:hypothetical protein
MIGGDAMEKPPIEILQVAETYAEYAVITHGEKGDSVVECDSRSAAEDMITTTGGELATRQHYVTEWHG